MSQKKMSEICDGDAVYLVDLESGTYWIYGGAACGIGAPEAVREFMGKLTNVEKVKEVEPIWRSAIR